MSPYRRSQSRRILAAAMVLAAILIRWYCAPLLERTNDRNSLDPGPLRPGVYAVEQVIDGDTFILADRHIHVRLQGIDTPEIAHDGAPAQRWSAEATTFTQHFVRDASGRVRLEIDGESLDHYGRSLAFVWDGERLLNEDLVRAGLARAMLDYDYSQVKKDRLRKAQQDAQRAARGRWSER